MRRYITLILGGRTFIHDRRLTGFSWLLVSVVILFAFIFVISLMAGQ